VCKNRTVDVVFAIDSSYSMRYAINSGATVISKVVEAVSVEKESRFGLFLYNDDDSKSDWIFKLTDGLTTEEIQDKLLELGWGYQYGEDPALAINTAVKELKDQKRLTMEHRERQN